MPEESTPIPEHELRSLDEARAFDDSVVILEGDYGGQIYLTCQVGMIRCSSKALHQLLRDIDAKCWSCNDGEGAGLYFERKPLGSGVWGGMGGGAVTAGLWLHDEVEGFGIRSQIESVLAGCQDRIVSSA